MESEHVRVVASTIHIAVDWGPVAAWVGAFGTLLVVTVTALVALGFFESLRGPRIRITFEPIQPWCRYGSGAGEAKRAVWVRVGVENVGAGPARGCVGRLISVATNGELRSDVDPVQLRWAGVPRARAFDPVNIRRAQREFLNVLYTPDQRYWQLVTFDDPDFDPGFSTELSVDERHLFQISVFGDNARAVTTELTFEPAQEGGDPRLKLS